jgi:hypothetical protein
MLTKQLDFTWRCEGDAFMYRAPGANETGYITAGVKVIFAVPKKF